MDSVLRAAAVYLALLILFRLSGKRSLAQVTPFDFVILLIVGGAATQALLGEDFSVTRSTIVVATLLLVSQLSDVLVYRFGWFRRAVEAVPVVLVVDGELVERSMRKEHLRIDDVLLAARSQEGIDRLEDIRLAVLETSGGISVVPCPDAERERT